MPVFRMIMINATSPFFFFLVGVLCRLAALNSQNCSSAFFSVINYYLKFNPVQYYTALYRLDAITDGLFSAFLLVGSRKILVPRSFAQFCPQFVYIASCSW